MSLLIAWSLVVAFAIATVFLVLRSRDRPRDARGSRAARAEVDTAEREIVERSREGVIVLSHALTPIMANASARAMMGFPPGGLPATLRSDELESLARRAVADASVVEAEIS